MPLRPSLAPGVTVNPPISADSTWVVRRADGSYLRVGADLGRLLMSLDGRQDADEIAHSQGEPWDVELVSSTLQELWDAELLDRGQGTPRSPTGRVRFLPPMSVQITLARPERPLARLKPLIDVLAGRGSLAIVAATIAGGFAALLFQLPAVITALSRPQSLGTLAIVMVSTLAATWLHEMGHAATLSHYGGKPSRMGIMLFYLNPVFFCDVSDGWRLPYGIQRARVALAGVVVQGTIAALAALAAAAEGVLNGDTAIRDALLLFSVLTLGAGAANFIPFVKFDGYIALMSYLDVPHLRARSMVDGRRAVSRTLYGGRYDRELPGRGWIPAFGVACIVFPIVLIGFGLGLWAGLLQGLGRVGAVLGVLVLVLIAQRFLLGSKRLLGEARKAGARPWRIVAVSTGLVALTVTALSVVPVPYTVSGGFIREAGSTWLVVPTIADVAAISNGQKVELLRRGVARREHLGQAVVSDSKTSPATVSMSVLFPITQPDIPVNVLRLPLSAVSGDLGSGTGMAIVTTKSVPIAAWLMRTYVEPLAR